MIKKWIQFNESRIDISKEEKSDLLKYFDIEPEDIKEVLQDVFDDYLELIMEIAVINYRLFFINFLPKEGGIVTPETYIIPKETQQNLINFLKRNGCKAVGTDIFLPWSKEKELIAASEKKSEFDGIVAYAPSKNYMYIRIELI